MGIRFNKIDGFIKIDDKIRSISIILFDYSYCDKICDKIRIDSFDSLPIKKILTFHNVIILINSLFQLLIRIKMNTTIIHFQKKTCIKISPIQNIFK